MGMMRWGMAAAGLIAAGVIGVAAIGIGGAASAQVGPEEEESRGERYRELLATELGITVEELAQAQTAARNQLIDELLDEGVITDEQAERLKALEPGEGLRFAIGRHMLGHKVHRAIVSVFEAAAEAVDLTVPELLERIAGGESLVDIAASQGIEEAALKAELVESLTARINQAVADDDLNQERANMLLENLDELVERAINAEGPFEPRFRFGGPRGLFGPDRN